MRVVPAHRKNILPLQLPLRRSSKTLCAAGRSPASCADHLVFFPIPLHAVQKRKPCITGFWRIAKNQLSIIFRAFCPLTRGLHNWFWLPGQGRFSCLPRRAGEVAERSEVVEGEKQVVCSYSVNFARAKTASFPPSQALRASSPALRGSLRGEQPHRWKFWGTLCPSTRVLHKRLLKDC